jgi:hypothetical protein
LGLNGCKISNEPPKELKEMAVDLSIIDTLSYRYVNLEHTPESGIGEISEMLFDDDHIFIFDSREPFKLFIFGDDGRYKSSITAGNLESEVPPGIWLTFDLDRQRKEILIYDISVQRILRFTYSGKFVRENKLVDYRGIQFAYLGNDSYAFWMESESDHQVLITDSVGFVISRHNPIPEKYSVLMSYIPGFFSKRSDNTAYYIPIWDDKIYKVSQSGVTLEADLKFSEKIVSTEEEINLVRVNRQVEKYSCFFSLHVTDAGQFYSSIRYLGDTGEGYTGMPLFWFGKLGSEEFTGGQLPERTDIVSKYGKGAGNPAGQYGDYFVRIINPDPITSDGLPTNPTLLFYKVRI